MLGKVRHFSARVVQFNLGYARLVQCRPVIFRFGLVRPW
jgi:hypothetical protein